MNQKIFIKTFGCQMNEYDSNRIYDSVKKIGFQKTENYEDANCYLLNTCHIRDKAKEKVKNVIKKTSSKNFNALMDWKALNPDYMKNEDKTDYFTKTISTIGKSTDSIDEKVIKKLCKETYVKDSV